jgi:transcriptional regulator with XRE-family HTH domain
MDAKTFGAFLARMRKSQGLTQAELAQQLHVTDKAVSRWERGVGLPDINTLEPLADALGLTLADLMHCRDPQEADIAPEVPLEDFFTLLRRQQSIDWRSVRAVLFWLSAALAIWGILACPGRMAVHWRTLKLWNNFEQTGYYRHWGEIGASVTRSMNFCSPAVRLWKFVLDLLFFFGFGFVIPCAEMMAILIN